MNNRCSEGWLEASLFVLVMVVFAVTIGNIKGIWDAVLVLWAG